MPDDPSNQILPSKDLKVNDVVIIADETIPAACWPLAKVIHVETGKPELVRVATVKTASSTYVRPIHKLIYLPIDEQALNT